MIEMLEPINMLTDTSFCGINKWTTAAEALSWDNVVDGMYSSGEGDFDVIKMLDENGKDLAYLWQNNGATFSSIEICDTSIVTPQGIKVGSSFADLLLLDPNIEAHGTEIEGRINVDVGNFCFLLSHREWSYDLEDLEGLNNSTVVVISLIFEE
ncbi:MAG: hypothetical protein COB65_01605 [Thalassobium sp.]|nr:MAG: hypothetical protein COB65_01605 [Thalassobium sp.]